MVDGRQYYVLYTALRQLSTNIPSTNIFSKSYNSVINLSVPMFRPSISSGHGSLCLRWSGSGGPAAHDLSASVLLSFVAYYCIVYLLPTIRGIGADN